MQWIIEIGRVDLDMDVSAMASTMTLPREGNLNAVFHMFSFLKSEHNGVTVLDPIEVGIDQTQFPIEDWSTTLFHAHGLVNRVWSR